MTFTNLTSAILSDSDCAASAMRTLTNAGLGERITACLHNAAPGVSRSLVLPSFFVVKLPRMWIWNQPDQNICIVPQTQRKMECDFRQNLLSFLQHSAEDFRLQDAAGADRIERDEQKRTEGAARKQANGNRKRLGHLKGAKTIAR